MTICILGDIHGDVDTLMAADKQLPSDCVAIQVGDLGWYKSYIPYFQTANLAHKWYWIRGNHEDHQLIKNFDDATEVAPNLFFVPDGKILTLDNKKILFVGGASSVDKMFRLRSGMDWSPLEDIMEETFHNIMAMDEKVDLIITHCPPQSVIQRNCDPRTLLMFGLPTSWRDPNADKIETIWNKFGNVPIYSGHMHLRVVDGFARILNINEAILIN